MKVRSLYALALLFTLLAAFSSGVAMRPRPHAQAATAAIVAATTVLSTTTPDTYFVLAVVDGDTLDIATGTSTTRLRLIGMDTPEVLDPRKPVQCFGKEASAKGHELLEKRWVRLEYDAVAGKKDKYDRTLAYVFLLDGTFYNLYMIRNGFAHEYDYDNQKYKYRAEFRAAQASAKEELLGFWSPETCDGNTTKPAGAA